MVQIANPYQPYILQDYLSTLTMPDLFIPARSCANLPHDAQPTHACQIHTITMAIIFDSTQS